MPASHFLKDVIPESTPSKTFGVHFSFFVLTSFYFLRSRFAAKFSKSNVEISHVTCVTCTPPPLSTPTHPHQNGSFIIIHKPTLTHRYHPKSIIYIRVHSWCCSLWLWTNVYRLIRFYCILLCCASRMLHFLQIEDSGNPVASKSADAIFPVVFARFVSLCHTLLVLSLFSHFLLLLYWL